MKLLNWKKSKTDEKRNIVYSEESLEDSTNYEQLMIMRTKKLKEHDKNVEVANGFVEHVLNYFSEIGCSNKSKVCNWYVGSEYTCKHVVEKVVEVHQKELGKGFKVKGFAAIVEHTIILEITVDEPSEVDL